MICMEKLKKIRRIFAGLTVIFILLLIVVMLVCAITGSKYFWAALFFMFMVPCVLWIFMWFSGILIKKTEDEAETDNSSKQG